MNSCIYKGLVNHKRFTPRVHQFNYMLYMMYVDLAELPNLFQRFLFWSVESPAIASFKRKDHYGSSEKSLEISIRELVAKETGYKCRGPIRLLTHFRYFGYVFNPLSLFYCFKEDGQTIDFIVAEVSNTPWKETHCYVLTDNNIDRNFFCCEHPKSFHVSPFLNMNMDYHWKISTPKDHLFVEIENIRENEKLFDASMAMKRLEINQLNLFRTLFNFPPMTMKVIAAIHFEALRLWLKGASYVAHPKNQ